MSQIILGVFLLTGSLICLIGAIGMVRFKDLYTRMHAASKAGAFALGLILISVMIAFAEISVVTRGLVGLLFFLFTSPVSAHLLARAAYRAGISPSDETRIDALKAYCDLPIQD